MADGRRYDLSGPSQTSLRAHASLFTSDLSTILAIKNEGTTRLVIQPDRFRALDREGHPLDRARLPRPPSTPKEVSLEPGSSYTLDAGFDVAPDADKLRTVTLIVDGVSRDGVAVPITVTFEKG